MREEKYTLNWHTYSDHLRDILKEMSSDDAFADVTLVTDDKKQMKAHRNISVLAVLFSRKYCRSILAIAIQ